MAKKIPRLESLIVIVFLLSVALWAIAKCSESRQERRRTAEEVEELQKPQVPALKRDTIYLPQPASPAATTAETPASSPPKTTPARRPTLSQTAAETAPPPSASDQYSTLYVTIDGLNVRKEPNRHSPVIARLKLYEPVLFLNRKSEQPEEVNLGRQKVTDYWVNIRTQSGQEGWVFGAGVHYYKTKHPGVGE